MTPHKARLLERLAAAKECGLVDEDKRSAVQLVLHAFYEWAIAEDIPPEHLELLVELAVALEDLNFGRSPEWLTPTPRPGPGHPGSETTHTVSLVFACAAAEVLPEQEVAQTIGMQIGAFRSWHKALRAGTKGADARDAYHKALSMVRELKPQEMRTVLAKKGFWPVMQK